MVMAKATRRRNTSEEKISGDDSLKNYVNNFDFTLPPFFKGFSPFWINIGRKKRDIEGKKLAFPLMMCHNYLQN
jgi:hypothetical protein